MSAAATYTIRDGMGEVVAGPGLTAEQAGRRALTYDGARYEVRYDADEGGYDLWISEGRRPWTRSVLWCEAATEDEAETHLLAAVAEAAEWGNLSINRDDDELYCCYAVVQAGVAVFGVGETLDEARQDARDNSDENAAALHAPFVSPVSGAYSDAETHSEFVAVACTRRFLDHAREFGGDARWERFEGGIDIAPEVTL